MDKIFIGDISFTPKTRCVDQDGREIKLRNKESEVLALLCDRYPDAVSRAQIEKAIWTDSYVTDNTLTQTISNLRNSLDDRKHELIITIPKKGYCIGIKPKFLYYDDPQSLNNLAENDQNFIASESKIDISNAPSLSVYNKKFSVTTWLMGCFLFLFFIFLSFFIIINKYQIKTVKVDTKNLPILVNLDEKKDYEFLKSYRKPHYLLLKKDADGSYFACYRYKVGLTCVRG